MAYTIKVEYAGDRKIRQRNKVIYRVAHWPIWIWIFFLAPGPLTFNLFANGPGFSNLFWLILVLLGTGVAAVFGQLPGVEPRPYILRFCEDRPNPLYRRICYTFAWNALISFALLNLIGLSVAALTGMWRLKQIYDFGYLPAFLLISFLGIAGKLPRVRRSTVGEGVERRYFYGAVWAITPAQTVLLLMWKTLPHTHPADVLKLAVFIAVLVMVGTAAAFGFLPRTRPILPGEFIVAD